MGSAGEASAELIVVGAGIAGLIAAWHLRQLRLLVLEAVVPARTMRANGAQRTWMTSTPPR